MYAQHLRPLVLALPILLLSLDASAELKPRSVDSPRDWFVGFQLGGYLPSVDSEFDGSSPFETTFGEKKRLLFQAGLERFVFKDFGTVGLGVSGGYSEFYAHAFFEDDRETRSQDNTSLVVVPVQATVSYRFDVAATEWNVPFVPYARAGAGYWFWWTGNQNGARSGYSLSGGLQLLLDVFDPRLSREFDREIGVNNSYLYVDYTWAKVDGFGSKGIDLSDDGMISGGLAFEF